MYSLIIHFGITKYELSLTILYSLLHMYHLSVLLPKQHKLPLIATSNIADAITRNGTQQQRARNCLANVETFENSIYHVVRPMGGRAPSQRGGHAPRQVVVFEVEL